jgi:hypothetical protein
MCRADDCDSPTISRSETRRARKLHRCSECGRQIAKGEIHRYHFCVYDGDVSTPRTCEHCCVAEDWLRANCGGYVIEQVIEEIREHAEEYPALALPLLRITVGAKRKWWRFDGAGFLGIPKMPPPIDVREH